MRATLRRAGWLVAMLLTVALVSEIPAATTWRLKVSGNPGTGDLVYGRDSNNITSLAAVASGQVLTSAGVNTPPAWSASPTFTGMTLATVTTTGTATFGNADADTHVSLGSWTGLRSLALVHTTGNLVLTNAHCGRTIINNATSATQTFTLPAVAAVPGCEITFLTGHADGETLINMAASGTCVITTFAAVGADADTAIVSDASCDTGLKNTAASNAIGDSLTLVSDGTRWLGKGITTGIYASQ